MSVPYTYILAEKDGTPIKIPYQEFANSFVTYTPEPASPATEGEQGNFSASDWVVDNGEESISSSAFVYSNNAWRKIPTYTEFWEDIEPTQDDNGIHYLRFLPVHKNIELPDEQKTIARQNLDIDKANNSELGLVKGSTLNKDYGAINVDEEDGSIKTVLATDDYAGSVILVETLDEETDHQAAVYTKQAIDEKFTKAGSFKIIPATMTTIGGIIVGENLTIDSEGLLSANKAFVQETPSYGMVKFAPSTYDPEETSDLVENEYVLSLAQSKALINHLIEDAHRDTLDIPLATADEIGGVRISEKYGNVVFNNAGVLNVTDAIPPVDDTPGKAGAVYLTTDIENQIQESNVVATAHTIKNYIDNKLENNIPHASNIEYGIVKIGAQLKLDSQGALTTDIPFASFSTNTPGIVNVTNSLSGNNVNSVLIPTGYAVNALIEKKIADNNKPLPTATSTKSGIVRLSISDSDTTTSTEAYVVPTVNRVNDLIESAIAGQAPEPTPSEETSSLAWVLMGTRSFSLQDVQKATLALDIDIKLISSNTNTNGANKVAEGINLLKFNRQISQSELRDIVAKMIDTDQSGTTIENCDNNFFALPATDTIGSLF